MKKILELKSWTRFLTKNGSNNEQNEINYEFVKNQIAKEIVDNDKLLYNEETKQITVSPDIGGITSGIEVIDALGYVPADEADLNTLQGQVDSVASGFLGAIAYNASAPTPAKSGYYVFSNAGVCSWLSGSPTVKNGDKAWIQFTSPSTYVRTYEKVDRTTIYSEAILPTIYNFKALNALDGSVVTTGTIHDHVGDYVEISAKKIYYFTAKSGGNSNVMLAFYNKVGDTYNFVKSVSGEISNYEVIKDATFTHIKQGWWYIPTASYYTKPLKLDYNFTESGLFASSDEAIFLKAKVDLYEQNALVQYPMFSILNDNVVNPIDWIIGGFGTWSISPYYSVIPGTVYYFASGGYAEFHDANHQTVGNQSYWLSGTPCPANVCFVKFQSQNITKFEDIATRGIFLSKTSTTYKRFGRVLDKNLFNYEEFFKTALSAFYPYKDKRGCFVGDSYALRGAYNGIADVCKFSGYDILDYNGQLIGAFAQLICNDDSRIAKLQNADVITCGGGTNDYGHGGGTLGAYYKTDANLYNSIIFNLELFLAANTGFEHNKFKYSGTVVSDGSLTIKIGKMVNTDPDVVESKTVTYLAGDTLQSIIDKVAALSFVGYTTSNDSKNRISFKCNSTSLNWDDYKIQISCTFNAEIVGEAYKYCDGTGRVENRGLSIYQLLSNNTETRYNTDSIQMGISNMINLVMYYKPDAVLVFVSQPERAQYATDPIDPPFKKGELNMAEISYTMEETCRRKGIPYVDTHSLMGINMGNLSIYLEDLLHLNAFGAAKFCRIIGGFINGL